MSELERLTRAFMAAVQRRDVAFLDAHLAPEFVLVTGRPGAETRARDEWLAVTRDRYVIEEFDFEELEALDYGTAGVVRSRYRQRGSMDGEDRSAAYLMTDVWIRRDGWQLVTRHLTPLP